MADQSAPASLAHPTPLVGREREQVALRAALDAALAGRGSLVLIGGEAGIGKTALAEALLAEATARGALVLVGRSYDLAETPPYGPWREAFARAPRADGLPVLPAAVLPSEGAGEALTSQEAIIGRVHAYLAACGARAPLAILLEDLHWSDPASFDLLRVVARGLADAPILVLATYRADEVLGEHPLFALLPLLVREARAARLDLRPLESPAIGALVAARYALGEADHARLAEYLAGRTEGNALFLGELLRTLEGEGVLRRADDGWHLGDLTRVPVPPLLRQVIAGRVRHLDPETGRLLAFAAVIGQEVPLALWAAVAEAAEDALLDHAERALAARLLAETPDGSVVRFAHALIREALYEATPALRRRAWHRRAAEALLATATPDPDAVAYHLRQAGDPRAAEWLLRAADRAYRAYAWIAAAGRVEAALALLEQRGGDPAERGWLRAHVAGLLLHVDGRRALVHAEGALALAAESGDRALAAYTQGRVGLLRCRDGHLRAGLAALAAAVETWESLSPEDQARLTARQTALGDTAPAQVFRGMLANYLTIAGRYDEAHAHAAPFVATDASPGACLALAMAATNRGRVDEGARWFAEARAIGRATGDRFLSGQFTFLQLLYLHLPYRADQPAEREQLAAAAAADYQLAAAAVRADAPPGLERLPLLALAGAWDAAWDLAQAVRASGGVNATNAQAALGSLALARGETALAQELVREVFPAGPATEPGDSVFRTGVTLQRVAAALALDAGDLGDARGWLAAHDRWLAWNGAVPGRAEGQLGWAAYHRAAGDLPAARRAAEQALADASEPRQPLALLAAHRALGELAAAASRLADAGTHLGAALALADACAALYERAITLLALAELHWATGRADEARAALAEVRAICERLGATPALARADRLAARLALVRPTAYPDALTEREVDVLRLVAAGRSNREAAAALAVSGRTVERHLESTYRKIGARNRTEATAYAIRHNLT